VRHRAAVAYAHCRDRNTRGFPRFVTSVPWSNEDATGGTKYPGTDRKGHRTGREITGRSGRVSCDCSVVPRERPDYMSASFDIVKRWRTFVVALWNNAANRVRNASTNKTALTMTTSSRYSSYNCLTSWDSYDRIPRYIARCSSKADHARSRWTFLRKDSSGTRGFDLRRSAST